MLITPVFEKQPITILSAGAVVDGGINTSLVKVGMPSDSDKVPFAGVLVEFAISPTGGSSNSGCDINVYRSFDGTNIDDQEVVLIQIAAGDIGASGTWYQTEIFPALPADSGEQSVGYAVRFNLSRNGGDRTLTGTVRMRRWRYLSGA